MLLFVSVLLALAILLISRWLFRPKVGTGRQPPDMGPCHWLWGHIPLISENMKAGKHIDSIVQEVLKEGKVGKIFMMRLGVINFCIVQDADAVKEALVTKNFHKSPTYLALHPFIGSKSMIVSEGEHWSQQRQAFNPSFAYAFLKQLVPKFADKAQALIQILDKAVCEGGREPVLKLQPLMTGVTMDIICEVALSTSFNTLNAVYDILVADGTCPAVEGELNGDFEMYHTFMELLDSTAEAARGPHLQWMRYIPWRWYKLHRLQSRFDKKLLCIIEQRLKAIKQAPEEAPTDILSYAIQSAGGVEGSLDREDILSQVKTFLFAGHDTTATTASFAIYEVSQNAEIERKIVEELKAVCPDRTPTAEDIQQMKYLNAVVKETLRFWPPGGTARMAEPGGTLAGYDVSNVILYIAHLPIHRDPDYWGPESHLFKPERWLDESYVAKLHPCCYMPFSKGPRDCIGQNFANLETKTLLAMLFKRFSFEYSYHEPEAQGYRITTYPKYGVNVKVHRRAP